MFLGSNKKSERLMVTTMDETEAKNNSSSSSSTSSAASSSSCLNPCPICLGPVDHESYLDRCFHKFCYNCIWHWAKVVANRQSKSCFSLKCPMCKTENFSIVHRYDGDSFERNYFSQDLGDSQYFTRAHRYRMQCYYLEPGSSDALTNTFKVSLYWKSHKFLQPNRWFHNWLRRELQSLIQEEDVDIIMHHILGIIDSFRRCRDAQRTSGGTTELKREKFKLLVLEAANPFLSGRTGQFVNEMELFLASGLNVEAYDKVYTRHLGWRIPQIMEEDEDEEFEHAPTVPCLYFFLEDSDEND